MDNNTVFNAKSQSQKVDQLHLETQQWKSNLLFLKDEILFIERLLNSYVFEPTTPNLFERLQQYQEGLKKEEVSITRISTTIANHEKDLGGMLECRDEACDLGYIQKHNKLKADMELRLSNFRQLKSEIFNYAGNILKRRKPNANT